MTLPTTEIGTHAYRCAELRAKAKALQERAEENLAHARGIREAAQGQLESLRQMVRDDAKRNGVELPEAIIEDSSPASMAIRCMFQIVALSDKGYRPGDSVLDHWQNNQELWFAHPEFNRVEYDRLCASCGLTTHNTGSNVL